MAKAHISHQEIADVVGLDMSTVSRLRAGQRKPNIDTMQRVEQAFAWPLADQVKARDLGPDRYAQDFEAHVRRYFSRRDEQPES